MAMFKHNFSLLIVTVIVLFLISFLGSTLYYFLAVSDDKLYDGENKYIDSSLTGNDLTADSNIKGSYKFNDNNNSWIMIIVRFIGVILKIFMIIIIPLFFYFLFINKKHAIIPFLKGLFK